MRTQVLSYVVAVHGNAVAEFPSGTINLTAAESLADRIAATLPPSFWQDGQKWENVVTVDQMVNGEYFGEASRRIGTAP